MGAVEYRFATFFVQAILMLCVTVLPLYFFFARRRLPMKEGCPRDGNVAWMFLTFHSAVESLMDSTRYDSSFMHFNAFVSIVQIVSAVCILAALIHYSRLSHKVNGRCGYHVAMWIGYVLTLVGNWRVGIPLCALRQHVSHLLHGHDHNLHHDGRHRVPHV